MITQIDQLYQIFPTHMEELATQKGIEIRFAAHYVDFHKEKKIVRISLKHFIYGSDIVNSFEYYHGAVEPTDFMGFNLVDYSLPKYHEVIGFGLFPVYFPSFSEPAVTATQYLEFANLKPGNNVIDLGAYSGLTSIMFKEIVGKLGTVIAVDADEQNIIAVRKNLTLYKKVTGLAIDLLHSAIWNHCDGLNFSSEGNMGSAASDFVGAGRGNNVQVRSLTLSRLAEMSKLEAVDFIKCDIEGAEAVIFEDKDFFAKFRPRIIIEPHLVGGKDTADKCVSDLESYNYECKRIHQTGVMLPLLECYPQ